MSTLKIPPYPTKRREAQDLFLRKDELLKSMLFMEEALSRGDFQYFVELTKARIELRGINQKLDNEIMRYYVHEFKK